MSDEQAVAPPRTSRVDAKAGVREDIEFVGSGPERIFSTLHAPTGQAKGAVLLCSSILAELLSGYQEEVWLCRLLAAEGFAVRRFHYRGTGHSDGEAEDITYEGLVDDARMVADHLRTETGFERIGVIGTRVGAVVGASIVSGQPGMPLSVIQPVLDLEKLFKEMGRARKISLMNEEGRSAEDGPPEDMFVVLERERSVDVLGYTLTEPIYQNLRTRKLTDELGPAPRPVQLVEVAKRKTISPEYQRFLDGLAAVGCETDGKLVSDEIAWWFHDTRRHLIPEIGDAIVPWISERLAQEGR
ncbi:MAG: alpha/beta hydrolase [Actinomycetota bacterium]